MSDMEDHYCEMWKEAKIPSERHILWLTIQNLRRLKVTLDSYYADYIVDKDNARIDAEKLKRNIRN